MPDFRIKEHPILSIPSKKTIPFFWQNERYLAQEDETIAAALFANGIKTFGHHHKDGSPLGIFCANGQCAQCMVIADGIPQKACMTNVLPEMKIEPNDSHPVLPQVKIQPVFKPIPEISVPVLIIGGGPAGLSAAIELGKRGIHAILIDDKHRLGGKLVLQTHRFFGSSNAAYAGTRGIDIAAILEKELVQYSTIEVWLQSTCLAVFSDKKIGVLKNNNCYVLISPDMTLVACGAREKFLAFAGNTLPGVFGAGAFQTMLNRDLVKPSEKLFIVGGGNVGLIAGYHALQAGIGVVGLVEALPQCGGYKVHKDKLVRMGVPIHPSTTILSANGTDKVESVTVCKVDQKFNPIHGEERSYSCDSVLIAVGLDPVTEFHQKALQFQMKSYVAGDAEEIAEASAAIFSGKIKGVEIAHALGYGSEDIPKNWIKTGEILKSRPGQIFTETSSIQPEGVIPVFHCCQEIPCDPCAALCPHGLISIDQKDIRAVPVFIGNNFCCEVCEKCVAGCPGLAITLVDYRLNPEKPIVSIPYEFSKEIISREDKVTILDTEGTPLGKVEILDIHNIPTSDRTMIIQVEVQKEIAPHIAGITIQKEVITQPLFQYIHHVEDDTIVCRCEHVTAGEIRKLINQGYHDINEIKSVTRACMGACGAKTCETMIRRLFNEEGIPFDKVTGLSKRPLFIEVPLGTLAGEQSSEDK